MMPETISLISLRPLWHSCCCPRGCLFLSWSGKWSLLQMSVNHNRRILVDLSIFSLLWLYLFTSNRGTTSNPFWRPFVPTDHRIFPAHTQFGPTAPSQAQGKWLNVFCSYFSSVNWEQWFLSVQGSYCGLNVCISVKFLCWNPTPVTWWY